MNPINPTAKIILIALVLTTLSGCLSSPPQPTNTKPSTIDAVILSVTPLQIPDWKSINSGWYNPSGSTSPVGNPVRTYVDKNLGTLNRQIAINLVLYSPTILRFVADEVPEGYRSTKEQYPLCENGNTDSPCIYRIEVAYDIPSTPAKMHLTVNGVLTPFDIDITNEPLKKAGFQ